MSVYYVSDTVFGTGVQWETRGPWSHGVYSLDRATVHNWIRVNALYSAEMKFTGSQPIHN